ncbi:MAG: SDR family oxidoreductase [Bifidobacterium crudilactis]|nr:SDR family oxidoreductase [Bifidobacterium crudilactis]
MAQVTIIGGHGKVALLASLLFNSQGDSVTSIIRNPAQASDVEKTGAQALILDIEHASTDELAKAFSGSDAIIWSAGAGGGDTARTYAVDRDAAKRCIDAAALAGVRRYITVSYYDADHPEVFGPEDSMYAYAQAKAAADTYLRESELEWTILGPTALTLQTPSGRITVDTARKTAAIPPTSVAMWQRYWSRPCTPPIPSGRQSTSMTAIRISTAHFRRRLPRTIPKCAESTAHASSCVCHG